MQFDAKKAEFPGVGLWEIVTALEELDHTAQHVFLDVRRTMGGSLDWIEDVETASSHLHYLSSLFFLGDSLELTSGSSWSIPFSAHRVMMGHLAQAAQVGNPYPKHIRIDADGDQPSFSWSMLLDNPRPFVHGLPSSASLTTLDIPFFCATVPDLLAFLPSENPGLRTLSITLSVPLFDPAATSDSEHTLLDPLFDLLRPNLEHLTLRLYHEIPEEDDEEELLQASLEDNLMRCTKLRSLALGGSEAAAGMLGVLRDLPDLTSLVMLPHFAKDTANSTYTSLLNSYLDSHLEPKPFAALRKLRLWVPDRIPDGVTADSLRTLLYELESRLSGCEVEIDTSRVEDPRRNAY
ncbi:hypothetical protein JCM10213_002054 [Rhodosporidiobolus nylandii]